MKTIQSLFQSSVRATATLKTAAILAALLCGLVGQAEAQIFVDADADGANDGTSWEDAYNHLQDALDEVNGNNNEIWVAEGTYYPDEGENQENNNRFATFDLDLNEKIYGGFDPDNGDDDFAERNWEANRTILSGDIDQDGTLTGNSSHVFTLDNTQLWALIDGVTITAGNANDDGGGMFSVDSRYNLTNVTFSGNSAFTSGGGLYNSRSTVTLTNVTFSGNSAGSRGGGIFNQGEFDDVSSRLINVTFSGNWAEFSGGGLYNDGSSPELTNVTFSGNFTRREDGGGMFNDPESSPTLANVILWGNAANGNNEIHNELGSTPAISYSVVQGQDLTGTGEGNLDGTDPATILQFEEPVDPNSAPTTTGNLSLLPGSSAINAGDNDALPADEFDLDGDGDTSEPIPVDLAGNDRIFNNDTVDMGAYEFLGEPGTPIQPGANNTLYVNLNVSGGNQSGNSWDNALSELRHALAWAEANATNWDEDNPLQIWVAEGQYLPTGSDTNRETTFQLLSHVEVYGGFDPDDGDDDFAERDWTANSTILSGDIDGDNTLAGNSYTVVTSSGTDPTARLDGFTITAGYAQTCQPPFPNPRCYGAGLYNDGGESVLVNLRFIGNRAAEFGGGLYNADGSLTLTNVIFSGNRAERDGGGMYNSDGDPTLTNVTFSGNQAENTGGGIHNSSGNPVITNAAFIGNQANTSGGGMFSRGGSPTLTNVTFSGNLAENTGGGIRNSSGNPVITNSILWGNSAGDSGNEMFNFTTNEITVTLSNSLIDNGDNDVVKDDFGGTITFDETNVIHTDPRFIDADGPDNVPGTADDDLRLLAFSPAINAGTNAPFGSGGVAEGVTTDLAGNDRIFNNGTVDIGAYEFQGEGIQPDGNILYVDRNVDTGTPDYIGTGNSWANAIPGLRVTLNWANKNWDASSDGTLQIWVAGGMYTPTDNTSIRDATFQLQNGVEILGGFPSGGAPLTSRDWETNETILSGDIDGDNTLAGNSWTVVNGSGTDNTALLNGFIITGGNANSGGGLAESGGGMYNSGSSPTLRNLSFVGNSANNTGGGMANFNGSAPALTNVIFSGNQAEGFGGGGMFNSDSSPTLANVTFAGNQADFNGGGILNAGNSTPILTNVIIWGNNADDSDNEIINGEDSTPVISHSLIQGGCPSGSDCGDGSTILDVDPRFADADGPDDVAGTADDDLSLQANSPAINKGDPDTDLSIFPTDDNGDAVDLAGEPRVFPDIIERIDIGAYEFQEELLSPVTSIELTGGEGWRMLASPVVGETYGGLLEPLWTQGVPGADYRGGDANVYRFDSASDDWSTEGISLAVDGTDPEPQGIGPGNGFIVYVFEDDEYGGEVDGGFPKTLTSEGDWLPLDGNFTIAGLEYSTPDPENPNINYTLLGNPYPVPLDFCEFDNNNIATSIDIWDPAANDGNGDYVNLMCGSDDVHIAPFQAFWVRTEDEDPGLPLMNIPEEAYLPGSEEGFFKESVAEERSAMSFPDIADLEQAGGSIVRLHVSDPQETFTNTARILLSEDATPGLDKGDGLKRSPAGLAQRWLSFYSMDSENRSYAFQNLPSDLLESSDKVSIPLDIQTTESGSFNLTWELPEPRDVGAANYYLRDNQSGEVMELKEGGSYRFEIESVAQPFQGSKPWKGSGESTHPMSVPAPIVVSASDTHRMNSGVEPRFELLIATEGVDGLAELADLPETFKLGQNYPNPFNPSTVIRYQLPASSDVRLEVYDMLGRRVATLVDEQVAAGTHQVNFNASNLSSGVYLYRLAANGPNGANQIFTKKLTLIK